MSLKNRKMQSKAHTGRGKSVQGELKTTMAKREECRMEERYVPHAWLAQGAGGYFFIDFICVYSFFTVLL